MIVDYDLISSKINDIDIFLSPYHDQRLEDILHRSDSIFICDHMGGRVDSILTKIQTIACDRKKFIHVHVPYLLIKILFEKPLESLYPNLLLHDNTLWQLHSLTKDFQNYRSHPTIKFENFLVSFNGSAHVSRKLLVAALHKRGWFDVDYSTKNFSYSRDEVDGHISDISSDSSRYYRNFFSLTDSDFNASIYSVEYQRFDHLNNCKILGDRLTKSFVHLVSETMATANFPIISEKFFYSIVNRGLFVLYASPGSHEFASSVLGFKKYENLFDYKFDSILNPIERLTELLSMLSKFCCLDTHEWNDLYEMEMDTIEYNYDHFFSGNFVNHYYDHCDKLIASNQKIST
jgi:hypothetical protein